jgi:hypothetical protein
MYITSLRWQVSRSISIWLFTTDARWGIREIVWWPIGSCFFLSPKKLSATFGDHGARQMQYSFVCVFDSWAPQPSLCCCSQDAGKRKKGKGIRRKWRAGRWGRVGSWWPEAGRHYFLYRARSNLHTCGILWEKQFSRYIRCWFARQKPLNFFFFFFSPANNHAGPYCIFFVSFREQ